MRSASHCLSHLSHRAWVCAALLAGAAHIVPAIAQPTDTLGHFLRDQGLAPNPTAPAPAHSNLVVHAMAYVGVPYRFGGTQFDEGFDCSGFVQAAFKHSTGIALPRTSREQALASTDIATEQLLPGDLVFFNTLGRPYSHVGIYVGEGRFVHSPRSGASVRIDNMQAPYWRARFDAARRVIPLDS